MSIESTPVSEVTPTDLSFTPVREVAIDLDNKEYSNKFSFEDSTYRVSVNGAPIDAPEPEGAQTLAQAIAPSEDEVAATFSSECANEFPSIHHLAPGNPLLGEFIKTLYNANDDPCRLNQQIETRPGREMQPVVCAWGRDGTLGQLTEDGYVFEDLETDVLSSWCEAFLKNRDSATDPP